MFFIFFITDIYFCVIKKYIKIIKKKGKFLEYCKIVRFYYFGFERKNKIFYFKLFYYFKVNIVYNINQDERQF